MATFAQGLNRSSDYLNYMASQGFPVSAGPQMIQTGWRAGTMVMWKEVEGVGNAHMVEISDGTVVCGMLIAPSEDYNIGATWAATVNWTSRQRLQAGPGYPSLPQNVVTIERGAIVAKIGNFERTALTGGGTRTGAAITYQTNDILYCSENGLLCNDSVANLIAAGIPAPTFLGYVVNPPAEYNNWSLEVDIRIS